MTVTARKTHPYYNFDRLLSFNATYNFLCGGRGLGKTYGAKMLVTRKFIKTGEQFIYVRRYKEELSAAKRTFFADYAHRFPAWDFQINGDEAQIAPVKTRDTKNRPWKTIGYFAALSTSQQRKSQAFPLVTTIIYDEFIIEKGVVRYIPQEAVVFNNFYSTVDRWLDKTRVLFLANAVSIDNPYFVEYGIEPDKGSEWLHKAKGFVLCHFPDSEDFKNSVYETRFGQFIKDSEYAEYAVENEFSDNHDGLISEKGYKASYHYSLETKNGIFSVWFDLSEQEFYVISRRPKDEVLFTLDVSRMGEDRMLMSYSSKPLQILRTAFGKGQVKFDSPKTRVAFTQIFKR